MVCVTLIALAAVGSASAASKGLSHAVQIDAIGQQLSGYADVEVDGENDPYEWGQLLGILGDTSPADQTLGFVTLFALPGSPTYHRIFISPSEWGSLLQAANGDWSDAYNEAVAVFDLTHEATHYRLFSTDEGRVNACALQLFPTVISTYFGVPATISQPTSVEHDTPIYSRVKRVHYVRVHGKRVRRVRYVRVQTGATVTYTDDGPPTTVPNPTYTSLVLDAQSFYASQPPPYSTGTCS